MDDPKKVWRVNRKPRFTVLDMGEYMAADDGPRETILRNMKYEKMARTLTYRTLYQAVGSFLASPIRDRRILASCKSHLENEAAAATNPTQKENLTYELRALEAFERSLNSLAISGFNLERVGATKPLAIEGVQVSVRPTAHVRASRSRGCDLVGALVVDLAKGALPKTEEAQTKLTKGMTNAAILVHQYTVQAFDGAEAKASEAHSIVFHSYRSEYVTAPAPYRKLLRSIEAACRGISRGWDNIAPPPNFDEKLATFRG